jgi:hypothetical protein
MDRHLAVREPLTTGVESQVSDAKDPEHGVPAARFSDSFRLSMPRLYARLKAFGSVLHASFGAPLT